MLQEQKERDRSELGVLQDGLGLRIEGVDSELSFCNTTCPAALCLPRSPRGVQGVARRVSAWAKNVRGTSECCLRCRVHCSDWGGGGTIRADWTANVILIRFTLLDPTEPDREFSLVVNLSEADYSGESATSGVPRLATSIRRCSHGGQDLKLIDQCRSASP